MIIVFFGQPGSGKTTLAMRIKKYLQLSKRNWRRDVHHIDGDELRAVFSNKDYSREGRIKNLNRASDIAAYLDSQGVDVVVSVVYPYEEARTYLQNLCKDVHWIYLQYSEDRNKNQYLVQDFEHPQQKLLSLQTSTSNVEDCILATINYIYGEDIL
jgi:adenylylsulfate kinase-like enzyme